MRWLVAERMRECYTNIGECARCALKSCFLFNHLNNECARNHGVLTTAFEHKKVSQTPFFEKKFSLELFQARTTHTTLTKRVETDEWARPCSLLESSIEKCVVHSLWHFLRQHALDGTEFAQTKTARKLVLLCIRFFSSQGQCLRPVWAGVNRGNFTKWFWSIFTFLVFQKVKLPR